MMIRMAPGEVSGLKNGEPVMAAVLAGDYKDRMADRLAIINKNKQQKKIGINSQDSRRLSV